MTHGTDGNESTYGTFGNGGAGRIESDPHYNLKMFGEVVKTFRKRARLTQDQFAPMVGYSLETCAPSSRDAACRLRTIRGSRTPSSTRSG